MTAFTEKLDRAAGAATCAVLAIGGARLIGAGVVGLAGGGAGVVPLSLGAAAFMASSFLNCNGWDPNGEGPPEEGLPVETCYKGASTFSIISTANGVDSNVYGFITEIKSITFDRMLDCEDVPVKVYRMNYEAIGLPDGNADLLYGLCDGKVYSWRQEFDGDPTCEIPGPPKDPPLDIPPFDYTDPDDGCELTVIFQGFGSGAGGNANPVFKIEPNAATRAESDVIGGCNFEPVIYMGDPNGGPPYVGPWNPDWDQPGSPPYQWEDQLKDIANICSNKDVLDLLNQLLVNPFPETSYALNSICELDDQGKPEVKTVERQIPSVPPLSSIARRIDALVPLLQGQKDFKQPICPPEKPQGEFRTIGFISENRSPNGRDYLRKRLRYRSVSGIGLDALIDHWKDFEFDAGPVIVKHRGASWGTITVWATSANEGKRVIRHAAAEALVNVDQVGRWEISGSASTRLGLSGRMKVNAKGGYYWITARDGSDNRPRVGLT